MSEHKPSVFPCKSAKVKEVLTLEETNKQISELKKKIQLSEGQRKALFEECESERKSNADQILRLKKEIAELLVMINQARSRMDPCLLQTTERNEKTIAPLVRKTFDKARETIDLKVIDLKKQLDLLKHKKKKKESYMKKLADEFQQLRSEKTANADRLIREKSVKKKVKSMENELHRVEVQLLEAGHVRKKYRSVRATLLSDSVKFESSLKKLEDATEEQQRETQHLQNINSEALTMRNATRSTLEDHQQSAMLSTKARERQLQEVKQRVESRHRQLERLERRIVQQMSRAPHRTGSIDNDDAAEQDTDNVPEEDETAHENALMEEAFQKLKEATGALETMGVLQRFQSQKDTLTRLMFLRKTMEDEKNKLEKKKERLTVELELLKFAEVKDKEQNVEEVARIESEIAKQIERTEYLEQEGESNAKLATFICTFLHGLSLSLKFAAANDDDSGVEEPLPDPTCYDELLQIVADRLGVTFALYENNNGVDSGIEVEKEKNKPSSAPQTDEKGPLPVAYTALTTKPIVSAMGLQPPQPMASPGSEDEDEVPSRGYLKRQAQLIVDAKSRRKTFRVQVPKRK